MSINKEMMRKKMARRVEVVILLVLLIIALAHLLRLLSGAEIVIAGTVLPVWTSVIGCGGPALLAYLFWWSHRD